MAYGSSRITGDSVISSRRKKWLITFSFIHKKHKERKQDEGVTSQSPLTVTLVFQHGSTLPKVSTISPNKATSRGPSNQIPEHILGTFFKLLLKSTKSPRENSGCQCSVEFPAWQMHQSRRMKSSYSRNSGHRGSVFKTLSDLDQSF